MTWKTNHQATNHLKTTNIMAFHKDKLDALVTPRSEAAIRRAENRKRNRDALRKSQEIALVLHYHLRSKGMTQKELADKLGVTPVYVGKLLKGGENLTLETICKLEQCIGENLVSVCKPYVSAVAVARATTLCFSADAEKSEKYRETVQLNKYNIFTGSSVA